MPTCRWCGGALKSDRNPGLGQYCQPRCRVSAALSLLEASEQAEAAAAAALGQQGGGILDELQGVVAQGGEDVLARLLGRLAGAHGPTLFGKLKDAVTSHVTPGGQGLGAQAGPGTGRGKPQQGRQQKSPKPPPKPRQSKRRTEREVLLGQLRLQPGATLQDVEKRYRELATALHPDVAGGDGGAMKSLNAARARLKELMKGG